MDPTEQILIEENVVDEPVVVASPGPNESDLYHYAELGAQVRLGQLETERVAILRTFPKLEWSPADCGSRPASSPATIVHRPTAGGGPPGHAGSQGKDQEWP